jgi:hypothetical protein
MMMKQFHFHLLLYFSQDGADGKTWLTFSRRQQPQLFFSMPNDGSSQFHHRNDAQRI